MKPSSVNVLKSWCKLITRLTIYCSYKLAQHIFPASSCRAKNNPFFPYAATVVACYGLAFSGGFTNSLVAMDWNSYLQAEGGEIEYPGTNVPDSAYSNPPNPLPSSVVEPSIGKYIGFMALIYFIGRFPEDSIQMHWIILTYFTQILYKYCKFPAASQKLLSGWSCCNYRSTILCFEHVSHHCAAILVWVLWLCDWGMRWFEMLLKLTCTLLWHCRWNCV